MKIEQLHFDGYDPREAALRRAYAKLGLNRERTERKWRPKDD